jgi:hypothetical protein
MRSSVNKLSTIEHRFAEEISWRSSAVTEKFSNPTETRRSACENVKCELKALFEVCDSVRLV